MLKKVNIICVLSIILLGGCQKKSDPPGNMNQTSLKESSKSINHLTSANEIIQDGPYKFLTASKVTSKKIDTYKFTNSLNIKANDDNEYTLAICDKQTDDLTKCNKQQFKKELNLTTTSPKYYVLTSENDEMDVIISTMTN